MRLAHIEAHSFTVRAQHRLVVVEQRGLEGVSRGRAPSLNQS